MSRSVLTIAAILCALALPAGTLGAPLDEDDDVRVAGSCSGASEASLRLRADDGAIRVELRIDTGRARATWRVVLLHERRIDYRGSLRTSSSSRSLRLRITVADWFGSDTIAARATGPRGETCRASATI
jgi:hypothetical protein